MNDHTFKRVFRVNGGDDAAIQATINQQWEAGGSLVSLQYPAGFHWAVLVFSYPEYDQ